jgi:hypothetical protein
MSDHLNHPNSLKTYPMMLKFIHESLPGGNIRYTEDDISTMSISSEGHIPSMTDIANRVAKEEGKELDEKQMITYEAICATFLLGLVVDGQNETTNLGKYFSETMKDNYHDDVSIISSVSCGQSSEDESDMSTIKSYNSSDSDVISNVHDNQDDNSNSSIDEATMASTVTTLTIESIPQSDDGTISMSSTFSNTSQDTEKRSNDFTSTNNSSNAIDHAKLEIKLKALGGKEQLLMFLTGPAGAGKTTAVKIAERFCFEFCKAVGILWHDNRFMFTAYTGSAASTFGGLTISKAAHLNKQKAIDDSEIMQWQGVRILVIDEISFMKSTEMKKLNENLQIMGQRTKPFGGYSIIFSGDFRQLEPTGAKPHEFLFSKDASVDWEAKLNAVIILENEHRFKDDPKYGKLLKKMWKNDINVKERKWLNERLVGGPQGITLPKADAFEDKDVVYASPYNRDRNGISAGNFKDHIIRTHPFIHEDRNPPTHTIIIEADMQSSTPLKSRKRGKKLSGILRHRILTTCGDANVKAGTKHVDPSLCLYIGAHLICTLGNENLDKKVPYGNGTCCRVVGIKLKDDQTSYVWKNYYKRKVWTVSASDVEWIECEHYPKSEEVKAIESQMSMEKLKLEEFKTTRHSSCTLDNIEQNIMTLEKELSNHRFKLNPRQDTVSINLRVHPMAPAKELYSCKMTQLPVNSNDATTGHKLQGMSKDVVIITSWPAGGLFKNWEYVVLSRVRTHKGLYLFQPISLEKSFKPSPELTFFFRRAKSKEKAFLKECKRFREKIKKK